MAQSPCLVYEAIELSPCPLPASPFSWHILMICSVDILVYLQFCQLDLLLFRVDYFWRCVRMSPPFAWLISIHLCSLSVDFLGSWKLFLSPEVSFLQLILSCQRGALFNMQRAKMPSILVFYPGFFSPHTCSPTASYILHHKPHRRKVWQILNRSTELCFVSCSDRRVNGREVEMILFLIQKSH